MCVAMPGEVVDVKDGTASVSFGTIKKNIVTTLIPDLKIGDYVLQLHHNLLLILCS